MKQQNIFANPLSIDDLKKKFEHAGKNLASFLDGNSCIEPGILHAEAAAH